MASSAKARLATTLKLKMMIRESSANDFKAYLPARNT